MEDSTPKKKPAKLPPNLSKFEDSPVFNFINSLSPIKPVKSIHITQTFNSISFPSLPVFTSPPQHHFSPLKSPKRPNFSNPSRSPPPVSKNEGGAVIIMDQLLEIFVPEIPTASTPVIPPQETVDSDAGEVVVFRCPISTEAREQEDEALFQNDCVLDTIEENKLLSNLQSGNMRRRCLDFEMAGNPNSATVEARAGDASIPVSSSSSSSSLRRTLPGIGLHLNSLAATLKNSDSDNLCSDSQPSLPSSSASIFASNSTRDQLLLASSTPDSENPPQESANLTGEELNQINPKKNWKLMENAGIGACKRCNCKKSRCLKLYCECFAAGVYCIEPCSCQDCFNKPIHEAMVLETRRQIESRNPLAFAPKVIMNSDSVSELGDDSNKTPASARHKRGCNCKKSGCLKKYCECYQGGVGCSINCRCEGCKNAFGRKDESALIGTEIEQEEEGREHCQKTIDIQSDEDQQNPSNAAPSTPLGPNRSLIPFPFQLKRRLPSFLNDESSSRLSVRFKLEKHGITQTEPKFEKTPCEDVTPETLCNGCPSITDVKSVSPNSKRVTLPPPQADFRPLPSTRIGRKLILQSIPSFPSLTNQNSGINGPSEL
ncbi:CRC domain-containing protein TSO1 [Cucumis melo var. makuwa]|uniref:CRC domain-containing protein TSO1 n=2 Tax=Cucumis melo TaxID=3656 RepID=A0A5D3E4C7_CUCMM|nr:CRC domain-containing protein TSO1 [Cucumis melo]KAA0057436.1 CRC domain-containing protein TSO1 [Cucumis melo var. makuwa]TYK30135.1 CRC domain-containing protein TSO1 [Cucumis melo var. makuwa]